MRIKKIVEEDFTNYKLPSMFIGTISCGGKCCTENNLPLSVCINDEWRSCAFIDASNDEIIHRYLNNPITEAIVFGGLEPLEQFDELLCFIDMLRKKYKCNDDVVIYTGYYKEEIAEEISKLQKYKNIVVKFGRFIPNMKSRFDEVLGVTLVSENQHAERIS